jgi:hypothetical protein
MRFFSVALLPLFIFCSSSWSGPIKVGNGGGFGELKILTLFENLDLYMERCLSLRNVCGLNPIEAAALVQISQAWQSQLEGEGLRFEHNFPGDFKSEGGFGDVLILDSQSLYLGTPPVAQASHRLGALLLSALSAKTVYGFQKQLGAKVFGDIREDLQSWKVNQGIVHLLQIRTSTSLQQHLAFEYEDRTFNLTPEILSKIACDLEKWQLRSPKTQGGIFAAQIYWTCSDGSNQNGQLLIANANQWRFTIAPANSQPIHTFSFEL